MADKEIRDLLYFDEPKALSLHSQLVGGLTKEIVNSEQSSSELGGSASLDAKILNVQLGRNKNSGSSHSETKTFHHDVLGRLENLLFSHGFALDLNEAVSDGYTDGAILRDLISDVSYIRLESVAKFHDHSRLIEIIERFPLLAEFISRCASDSIQKSDEYSLITEQINQKRIEIKQISNRNQRAKEKSKLDSLQQKLDAILEANIGESMPQPWFVNGLSNWVNMFNPDHLHIRFDVPNSSDGAQVVANLQRHLFTTLVLNK